MPTPYKKIVCFPDRGYLYNDSNQWNNLDQLVAFALDAGATGIILNPGDKKFPYSGDQSEHRRQCTIIHDALNVCDAQNAEAYLFCANISKYHNGHPVGIPTQYDKNYRVADDAEFSLRIPMRAGLTSGNSTTGDYPLPAGRSWIISIEIISGAASIYWHRKNDPNQTWAAKFENLKPGDHSLVVHSLESNEWQLTVRGAPDCQMVLYPPHQRGEITVTEDLSYLFTRNARGPEHAELFDLALLHKERMTNLKHEFWFTDAVPIPAHKSLKGGAIFSDEPEATHWTDDSLRMYNSAAHAFVTHLNLVTQQANKIFGGAPLYFGDVFGHNRRKYVRNNNPANGGFENSLHYLPARNPGIPIMWYEGNDPEKIFADFMHVAGLGRPWLLGHQLGEINPQAAAEALNLCAARNLTMPIGSVFFGWGKPDFYSTANLQLEFSFLPDEV